VDKIYTITKYSYKEEDSSCFLPGIFCHNATSEDHLLDLIMMHITDPTIKDKWMNKDSNEEDIFYVTYNSSFEEHFYHGYRVTEVDLTNGSNTVVTKENNPTLWDKINKLVTETTV